MRIVDPQSAVLTNVEVLAFLNENPPRRNPGPPPGVKHKYYIPKPDLRDHNTVVKEIHNYAERISPHLIGYLEYVDQDSGNGNGNGSARVNGQEGASASISKQSAPLDLALREAIVRTKPYGLTKGEFLMLLNLGIGYLGVGVDNEGEEGAAAAEEEEKSQDEDVDGPAVKVDTEGHQNGDEENVIVEDDEGDVDGDGNGGIGTAEGEEGDSGVDGIMRSVIEKCSERLSDDDIFSIVSILREIFGPSRTP